MKRIFLACCFLRIISLFATESPINFYSELDDETLIQEIVTQMTVDEKIGQVLMLGYMGDLPSREIMEWVEGKHIGGIKIFGWNADNLSNMTHTISVMQESAKSNRFSIPLLIATDQEGGWVRHVRGDTSITPGNMSLGAGGYLYDAWKTGYFIGLELHTLGINMNFAPVVDIYLNPKADVIGPRAFSGDPINTAMLGLSFYKGMDAAGVISTAKHFPGHGDTDKDSHGTLPELSVTLEDLSAKDLLPYRILISDEIPSIMIGHLAFPEITDVVEPASLSRYFISDLLRDSMNFKGLVISDDLFMHGARSDGMPLYEVCEKGLRAGLDVLLVSRNPREHIKIWNHLTNMMVDDPDFALIVDKAVASVLRTKLQYLKTENSVPLSPDSENIHNTIPAPGTDLYFQQQALRSVTLLKRDAIPLDRDKKYLLTGTFSSFFYEGRERFPRSDFHKFSYNASNSEIDNASQYILGIAQNYDKIIFNLHNDDSLEILKRLKPIEDRIVVLSVLTPVYLSEVQWVKSSIAVYGTGDESFKAGFSVLAGDYVPDGTIPVLMEGLVD